MKAGASLIPTPSPLPVFDLAYCKRSATAKTGGGEGLGMRLGWSWNVDFLSSQSLFLATQNCK